MAFIKRNLENTYYGLTQDEWRKLCLTAFENLTSDTTITMNDVDAILTWCIPEYEAIKKGRSLSLKYDDEHKYLRKQ
jgi:hypothetical protein